MNLNPDVGAPTVRQTVQMSEASKKGYSIWSLLVIMTLLAVWLAIPRVCRGDRRFAELFVVFHQLMLWLLVADLVWLLTGKHKFGVVIMAILLFILWSPGVIGVSETAIFNTRHTIEFLQQTGLYAPYTSFYRFLDQVFGYGLSS